MSAWRDRQLRSHGVADARILRGRERQAHEKRGGGECVFHAVASTEKRSPGRRWLNSSEAAVRDVNPIDMAVAWPSPAGLQRCGNRLLRPREHRLDSAIAPVAHPALEAEALRRVLDKRAEADALHAAVDDDVPHDHPISPVSAGRAPR